MVPAFWILHLFGCPKNSFSIFLFGRVRRKSQARFPSRKLTLKLSASFQMATARSASRIASYLPYWWGDNGDGEDGPKDLQPPLNSDHKTDLLVIGGGFTGMSVAREMKKRHPDLKVTICEGVFSGAGASGRNGGFLTPLLGHDNQHLINTFGEKGAKKACQIMRDSVDEVHDLIKENQIECNYSPHGILYAAWTPQHAEKIRTNQKASLQLGYQTQILSNENMRQLLGGASDALGEGFYEKSNSGNFNPYKLTRGLLKKTVLPLGVEVYENSPVTDLNWENESLVTCKVNGHTVEAKNVAICTNSYTETGGLGMYKRSFVPLHVYQVVTEVLSPEAREKLNWDVTKGPPAFYTLHRILFGVRYTYDGRIAMGTGLVRYYLGNPVHVKESSEIYPILENKIYEFFPGLKETPLKIDYRWEGVVCSTLDDMPIMGRDPKRKNIFYSFGYNGHGNSLANYSGHILADLYDDHDAALKKYEGVQFIGKSPYPTIPVPPDPLRAIAVNAIIRQKYYADRFEEKFGVNGDLPFLGGASLVVGYGLLRTFRRLFRK